MKKNVWSNAEFYLLLGMLVFCAILVWQFSIITVSESRIFPSVILAVSISAAAIQAVHVFGKGDFLDVHKALLTGREWLALLVLLASYFSYDRLGFYATIFLVLISSRERLSSTFISPASTLEEKADLMARRRIFLGST